MMILVTSLMTYRTASMTHSNVTFDVKSWCSRKTKGLEMSIDQGLIEGVVHSPSSLEFRNQFGVNWASVMIDELNLLVGPIVCVAVVDDNVKSIPLTPHEDHEGERIPDVDWLGHPVPTGSITLPDLHMTGRGCQSEMDRISRVHPKFIIKVLDLELG